MKKEFFNSEKLNSLKKDEISIFLRIFFISIIFITLTILIFVFQNRDTMNLFIVLGGTLTTCYLVYLFVEIKEFLLYIIRINKLVKRIRKSSKVAFEVSFVNESFIEITYLGLSSKAIKVVESDDKNVFLIYITSDEELDIDFAKTYQITTYHNFLLSIKEKNDERN